MEQKLKFTLDANPLSSEEQALFLGDARKQGLDEGAIALLNRLTLSTAPASIPKVLRGFAAGKLSAVAWIIECRQPFQHILPGWFSRFMDMPRLPIFNPTKAAMMEYFHSNELHFYTRHSWLRMGLPALIGRSTLGPGKLAPYCQL